MGFLDKLFGKKVQSISNNKKYADSSCIPQNERQYYQPDEYYTLSSYPETMMEKPVVLFDERKKISYPSKRGLYVAEILLLAYCQKGQYPNPKKGYPGFWWFEYGIRDVGGKLRELAAKGFIVLDKDTQKYTLTDLGLSELKENEYVEYVHKSKKKTLENARIGDAAFNVWSVNKLIHQHPNIDPWILVKEAEQKVTSSFDAGSDAEQAGDEEAAIRIYEKQVAERFDGNHPYDRLAVIYRKRKDYDKEIEVLLKAIDVFTNDVNPDRVDRKIKLERFKERLTKAKELQAKSKSTK